MARRSKKQKTDNNNDGDSDDNNTIQDEIDKDNENSVDMSIVSKIYNIYIFIQY